MTASSDTPPQSTSSVPPTPPASPLRVLICGAGIAGTALALVLARAGHDVVMLEKSPHRRPAGQNVDVRGTAREVLRRLGLEEQVRAAGTGERGTRFVDDRGRSVASFPVTEDGDRGPTAELEVLRSTLAQLLLDALPESVRLRQGVVLDSWEETEAGVETRDSAGNHEVIDVLVGAEGVGSPLRGQLFPTGPEIRRLGLGMAFATIPRHAEDDDWWRWHLAGRGRSASLRPDPEGTERVLLSWATGPFDAAPERLLPELRRVYGGAGWETPRILEDLENSEDLYADDLRQIRCPQWSQGRAILLGDSAWCATPVSGAGASLSITGAYVLGIELVTAAARAEQNAAEGEKAEAAHQERVVTEAFARFEQWMRPVVERAQTLPPGAPGVMHPTSTAGLAALKLFLKASASRPMQRLLGVGGRMFGGGAPSGYVLPEGPDLSAA